VDKLDIPSRYPKFSDDQVVRAHIRAWARRDAIIASASMDEIKELVAKYVTPLGLELVIRGISAFRVPLPTPAQVKEAAVHDNAWILRV
jgi:hypothetical protein